VFRPEQPWRRRKLPPRFRFTTLKTVPSVTTSNFVVTAATAAAGGGAVTADGGDPVTARGVCYGVSTAPTLAGLRSARRHDRHGRILVRVDGPAAETEVLHPGPIASNSVALAYGNETNVTTRDCQRQPTCMPRSTNATGFTAAWDAVDGAAN